MFAITDTEYSELSMLNFLAFIAYPVLLYTLALKTPQKDLIWQLQIYWLNKLTMKHEKTIMYIQIMTYYHQISKIINMSNTEP